jgi:CRP-like cAMP-binding protein
LENKLQNQLLLRLSSADYALLGPATTVNLPLRARIESRGDAVRYVYFLSEGIALTVATLVDLSCGVGLTGREGFVGSGLLDGDELVSLDCIMQVAGSAQRYDLAAVKNAMTESSAIDRLLRRSVKASTIQMATTVWSTSHALLEARLARWLLMLSDRVGPIFEITHESIAMMLSVRRSGVTVAVQTIEGRGLIRASRGRIQILHRERLVQLAGPAYGFAELEQTRLSQI